MEVWTIQDFGAWKRMLDTSVMQAPKNTRLCDFSDPDTGKPFDTWQAAYDWLAEEMKKTIGKPPKGVRYPMWTYYKDEGRTGRPDDAIRDNDNAYSCSHHPFVVLRLEVPEDKILLSEMDSWTSALNGDVFLDDNGKLSDEEWEDTWDKLQKYCYDNPDVKEKLWQETIIGSQEDRKNENAVIQGTLWEIRPEWVKSVEIYNVPKEKFSHLDIRKSMRPFVEENLKTIDRFSSAKKSLQKHGYSGLMDSDVYMLMDVQKYLDQNGFTGNEKAEIMRTMETMMNRREQLNSIENKMFSEDEKADWPDDPVRDKLEDKIENNRIAAEDVTKALAGMARTGEGACYSWCSPVEPKIKRAGENVYQVLAQDGTVRTCGLKDAIDMFYKKAQAFEETQWDKEIEDLISASKKPHREGLDIPEQVHETEEEFTA